jgi:hypothetical protein
VLGFGGDTVLVFGRCGCDEGVGKVEKERGMSKRALFSVW